MQEGALPLIQLAVTPVILITGLGSLLLTMTNRLGRIVDRTRILAGQMRGTVGDERDHVELQLKIMYKRAKLVRLADTLTATSMFISGLLMVVIFTSALLERDWAGAIVGLFIMSIVFLLASLALFIRDIFMSLIAVGAEVERVLGTVTREGQESAKTAALKVAKSG